jgi:hypothetical protein
MMDAIDRPPQTGDKGIYLRLPPKDLPRHPGGILLVIAAAGLELFARFTHRRCRDTTAGFDCHWRGSAWPFTEIGHFRLGLSLTALLLAAFIPAVEAFRRHGSGDLAILSAGSAPVLVAGLPVLNKFRARRNPIADWTP